jgi:hypothetical protein
MHAVALNGRHIVRVPAQDHPERPRLRRRPAPYVRSRDAHPGPDGSDEYEEDQDGHRVGGLDAHSHAETVDPNAGVNVVLRDDFRGLQ